MPLPRVFGTEHELVINIRKGNFDSYDKMEMETRLAVKLLERFRRRFYPEIDRHRRLQGFPPSEQIEFSADKDEQALSGHVPPFQGGFMTSLGSRFYIDHGYFELSSAECDDPFVYLASQIAHEELVAAEFEKLFGGNPLCPRLYKNVSDGCGHSQAAHRSFCVSADLWPRLVSKCLAAKDRRFFGRRISRETNLLLTWHAVEQLLAGAGKYGDEFVPPSGSHGDVGMAAQRIVFQLSGRADFTEKLVGEETTNCRPIVNQRWEPLADGAKYGRYHCINGDANRAEWPHLFKMGLTALVLGMLEDDALDIDFYVSDPVWAIKAVSRDATCQKPIGVTSFGGNDFAISPLQIMEIFLAEMKRYASSRSVPEWCGRILDKAEWALWALRYNPELLESVLDWKIKERVGRNRPNAFNLHLNYHALASPAPLYRILCENGNIETVVPRDTIEKYKKGPPETTRAYFRGKFLKRFCGEVDLPATGWDEIVLGRLGASGSAAFVIRMPEPLELTKKDWGAILEEGATTLEPFEKLIAVCPAIGVRKEESNG